MKKSSLEIAFDTALAIHAPDLPAHVTQYRFHPIRRWRFDVAWPESRVAVELMGGTWSRRKSGHTSGKGYDADCEKANAAAEMGWIVLRITSSMLESDPAGCFALIKNVLDGKMANM